MNKKNIIQFVVIVACFAASAIVIYNNFIKKTTYVSPIVPGLGVTASNVDEPILPNGNVFDLKKLKESKLRFNLLDYPSVKYPDEVGIDEQNIIKPLKLTQEGSKPAGK